MQDITNNFDTLYYPTSALLIYRSEKINTESYIEYLDISKSGMPMNAHPLTVKEAERLAKALKVIDNSYLKPSGIMGSNILHIDVEKSKVIWFTKATEQKLYFNRNLGIPNGKANVPAMLWVADINSLSVFALTTNKRPTGSTILYDAPFFNIYENGRVCMGTVDVDIKKTVSLEEFTKEWENYFFNSYFSHLMAGFNPIKGNCVSLWKDLIGTNAQFPKEVLKKTWKTLKNLL